MNIFRRETYDLTEQDYRENRTLIYAQYIDIMDRNHMPEIPENAKFELKFFACINNRVGVMSIFLSNAEYTKLLTDDISKITLHAAMKAEEATLQEAKEQGINTEKYEERRNKSLKFFKLDKTKTADGNEAKKDDGMKK